MPQSQPIILQACAQQAACVVRTNGVVAMSTSLRGFLLSVVYRFPVICTATLSEESLTFGLKPRGLVQSAEYAPGIIPRPICSPRFR